MSLTRRTNRSKTFWSELRSNEPSDAERIKIAAQGLVHQLRGRYPEGFIRSNLNEYLVKKPLSVLEHATDEGIHNKI